MIVSDLIAILQQLPQDSKVVIPHLYRLKMGVLKESVWDILSVSPRYDEANNLINYTIRSNIKPSDVKQIIF
ncbi:hypothetical protein [Clostridium sp.]|uniref:hypothetical protein n=1 Tax=Clostridium sp. TaxID=1506 RepID=UPI0026177A2C|nr:hypothetical protein [uncultured Clostridium sp.]